jgi:hypothetical protein
LDSSEDVVVIKFIYGMACTRLDSYQDIIVANVINSELLELPVSLNGNLARRKVSVCEDMVAPPPDQAPHSTTPSLSSS